MSVFDGLGDELQDAPLVDDSQREPLRSTVLGEKPTSPFQGLADQVDLPDPLPATLTEASKKNPDAYAKAAKLARQQGVSPQIIEPSLEEFERQSKIAKINTVQMAKDFSVTAGFLSNYDNAAQFHDDIDTLTGLEKWIKNKVDYLGGRFDRGQAVVEIGELQSREVYNRLGIPGGVELTDEERERVERLNTSLKVAELDEQGQFFKMIGAATEQLPILGSMLNAGAKPLAEGLGVGAAAGATTALVAGQAGPQIAAPEEIVTVPAGAVTGGLLGLRTMIPVAKAATIKQILDVEVGNAFNEYSREKDADGNQMDPQVAAYAAAGYGVLAAALESFSLSKLGNVFSGPKDAFNRTIKNRIKTILKDKTTREKVVDLGKTWGDLIVTESVTEALQEGAQVVAGAFAKYADKDSFTQQDLNAVLDEIFSVETLEKMGHGAVEGARASAVFGAAGVVTTVAVEGVQAETKTTGEQRKIDELAELVKESKGIQRNPEAVREFLQQVTTEDDNVYLPAERVLEYLTENNIDPYTDPVFQPIARQIDEAMGLGGDVVIPVPDFVTGIAASDHLEGLRPHMRLSADSLAPSEMVQVKEHQSFVDQLLKEAEGEADIYAEAQSVYEQVREQLIDTGRANPQVAKLQAQIIPAYVTRLAKQTGRGVRELFDEMALTIQGPMVDQQAQNAERAAALGVTLDQDGVEYNQGQIVTETEAFKKWFGESKVVDETGAPLVVYHGTNQPVSSFAEERLGESTKTPAAGVGFFFTASTEEAGQYADYSAKRQIANAVNHEKEMIRLLKEQEKAERRGDWGRVDELTVEIENLDLGAIRAEPQGGNVIPVHLSLRNPLVVEVGGKPYSQGDILDRVTEAKEGGHDGLILRGIQDAPTEEQIPGGTIQYVAFSPTQIKSVFNRGTFDPQDPNILNQDSFVDRVVTALNQTDGIGVIEEVAAPLAQDTFYQVHPESQKKWRDETSKWMKQNGYSQKEIDRHLQAMDGQMAIFEALGPLEMELFPRGAGAVKADVNSKGIGGPFRSNADPIYKITFDASAMCVKRLEAAETAAAIQSKLGRALTTSERMALVSLFKMADKQAPCVYCYVEAPRAKMAEFVQRGIDIAFGDKEAPAAWSQSMRQLAARAKEQVVELGITREKFDPNLFVDPDFLQANLDRAQDLFLEAPIVYDFINKSGLAAKANLPKLYEEYSGQILQLPQELITELNGYAGLRFFSSSDFQVEHVADLMQAFVDMELRKVKAHAYTKVPMFAEIFGKTGMKIQTSIFARKDKDGKIVEDNWQGMNWDDAKRLRTENENVGSVLVATSDEILQWGLEQDWVDYIIPFHYSGLEKKFYGALDWEDFTSTQSEKSIDGSKAQKIRMYEITGGKGLSQEQATRKYLELAMKRKLIPVFPAFVFKDGQRPVEGVKEVDQRQAINRREKERWAQMVANKAIDWDAVNPNYFKLKKDYARTDTRFGPVKANFNRDALGAALESFLAGREPKAQVDQMIVERFLDLHQQYEGTDRDMGVETLKAADANKTFFQGVTDVEKLRQNVRETVAREISAGRVAGQFQATRLTLPQIREIQRLGGSDLIIRISGPDTPGDAGWYLDDRRLTDRVTDYDTGQKRNLFSDELKNYVSEILATGEDTQIGTVMVNGRPQSIDINDDRTFFQSQPAGVKARGLYDANANMIRLLEASDLSTFLHESAHFFLEMEKRFNPAGMQGVTDWFARNAATIALEANKYLGQSGAVEQSGRRLTPADYERMISEQRKVEGLRAAIRDPETGKIYTGGTHKSAIKSAPYKDGFPFTEEMKLSTASRLEQEWDAETDNVGFVDNDGKFISREEAGKRWNIYTVEDARDFIRNRKDRFEQSAFHGSPHLFDKFTLQKIGTGEGAQAYGWGLYFAGNKEVAQYYKDKLSESLTGSVADQILAKWEPARTGSNADRLLRLISANNSLNDADIKSAGLEPESFGFEDIEDEVSVKSLPRYNFGAEDAIRGIEKDEKRFNIYLFRDKSVIADNGEEYFALDGATGRLYHVELAPKDDEWLLWDKPLSEQSEKVRAALEKGWDELPEDLRDLYEEKMNVGVEDMTGKELYSVLRRAHQDDALPTLQEEYERQVQDHEAASRFLHSLGIHGIKYLDGSSRGKGEGDYNFVLFDDSLVEITRFEQSQQTPGTAPGPITEEMVLQFLIDGGTGDKAVDDAINRATHEQFARGFETYLMEGTAPSLDLREAFRAFARWLTDLYRKMKGDLQVNLDDEMRKVFDRLLATEDQIAAVEAANRFRPLFTDAAMAGMTQEEFAAYQAREQRATDKARETLQEKIFKELKRETEQWWQEEKAERAKVITEQLKRQPVYNAIEQLRTKNGEIKLDRAQVKEMLGVDRVPDQLRGMTLTGMQGVSPDDAAAFLGYDSGHQMLTEIMTARPIREVAAEQAETEMKVEHGDILNDGTLEREAQDAAHNEERGKQILVELKTLARAQNRPAIDRAAIKALAEENIGRLPLTRILPAKYRRAEIKAAQAAQSAMDAGDRAAALQHKLTQAMNFYLWRAATDARTRADKIVRFTRKYGKKSIREQIAKAGNGYMEQIDGILERFEFDRSVKKTQAERQAITEWAMERAEEGDNIQLTREVLDETLRKHYREIPFDTLVGVYDSIRNIDHVARFANKVKKDGELLDFLEVKREVLQHLEKLPKKFQPKVADVVNTSLGQKARWAMAQMTKLPVMFTWLDGGRRAGLIHKLMAQPFTDAAAERLRIYREVGASVVDAIRNRSKADQKRHNTKIHIPEAVSDVNDGTFMGHQILSVALNTGNLSNLEKMLKGEGWVAPDAAMEEITIQNPQLQAVLSRMSDSDWTLVELIWEQIDLLYPMMAEVHKRTSGLELPKIEAVPFRVASPTQPDGRMIRGGYYPVKYDPNRGDRAEHNEQRQQAMIDSMFGPGGIFKPSSDTGAKIERTAFFAPIRFSLDVVPTHIDEVIQYITHYEAIQQVYKLTHDPDIKAAIRQRLGKDEFNQIRPWLNDIAKEGKESPAKQLWDPLLQRLRFGTTLGMMGFKVSTGIMQISGLSNSVGEVGIKYMARSMRHVLGSLGDKKRTAEMWGFVTDRSRIMGDRIDTMDRELMNAMTTLRGKSGMLKAVQETSLKHIAYIQTYSVDLPTWYGAYYKGLDEAKAQLDAEDFDSFDAYSTAVEEQAIRRADWTVENVQGSGMTKDMARIMRNQTETGRMLTMFFTFFSSMWNMQRDTVRGARSGLYSPTTLAAKLLFLYMIPVAYEMALRGEMEDDDDETAAEKYLTRLALYPLQTVPVVRDIANAAGTGFDFQMTPVAGIIAKGIKSSTKAGSAMIDDEEISKANVKNISKAAGAYFGLPGVSQAWNTGEHLYQVLEEGDDLTMQELLFGPKREN